MSPCTARRLGLGLATLVGASCSGEPSALDPAGSGAREIASLWWVMFVLGTAVLVLVVVVLLRSARGSAPGDGAANGDADQRAAVDAAEDQTQHTGRRWILWGGVVLPVLVLLPVSLMTLIIGNRLGAPPEDGAIEVELTGHQFWWEVRYPGTGAVTANEIHVPAGRDVRITMTSEDVIHSFWVPSLHGKVDLIPGEDTELVIDADEPGRHEALCAEYCGIQHTHMKLLVVVHPPEEFEAWMDREAEDAVEPASERTRAGADVFARVGCASCHSVRGTDAEGVVGPDLTHVGSRLTLGANTIPNTRGNLGGWVANPQRIKPGNRMPPTVLDGPELIALLDYLESLE